MGDNRLQSILAGRSALITGASRGVGRAVALALAPFGMRLGLLARTTDKLEETARDVVGAGSETLVLPADLRDRNSIDAAARRFTDTWGTPDVLVNNAGIGLRSLWTDATLEEELDVLAVNFTAPLILIRAFLPGMLRQRTGHIININTIGGMYPAPYQGIYCAGKAAFSSYCTSLAHELCRTGVHLSTLYPGPIATDFLDGPNFEGFKASPEIVTPENLAARLLNVIERPRPGLFVGPLWKLLAVKVAGLHPAFFGRLIEKKNLPPRPRETRDA